MSVPISLTIDPADIPPGPPGIGITDVAVNGAGHLIVTLTDGTTRDAGLTVPRPRVVRTWDNWTNWVPITVGADPYKYFTEFGMAMPQRNPGDVIRVEARAEVTNPYPFNVQLGRYIGYGLPDAQQHATPALCPIRTENITPNEHHAAVDIAAVIDDQLLVHLGLPLTLPANWVLTLMLQAASSGASPGQALVHEGPGYGELVAVIFPAK